jgi:hypothetical protein
MSGKSETGWRRDRDSNPGYGCPHSSFRDYPVRPLRHLSAARNFAGLARSQVDLGARRLAQGHLLAKPLDGHRGDARTDPACGATLNAACFATAKGYIPLLWNVSSSFRRLPGAPLMCPAMLMPASASAMSCATVHSISAG